MPKTSDCRMVPYSAAQMFDLVADVAKYPDFLPWCAAARIRSDQGGAVERILVADLVISFKVFREKFGSRVKLRQQDRTIETEYLDGPFKYLKSNWRFVDTEQGCEVHFFVDFEFKNAVLQSIIGVMFGEAMARIVQAFEGRARALYG